MEGISIDVFEVFFDVVLLDTFGMEVFGAIGGGAFGDLIFSFVFGSNLFFLFFIFFTLILL